MTRWSHNCVIGARKTTWYAVQDKSLLAENLGKYIQQQSFASSLINAR